MNEPASAGCLDAALDYAARGWPVLPVHDKRPLVSRGVHDATTNESVIRDWWSRWPHAGVAIATGRASGLVVLDVDPRHGGDESLARLGPLPTSREAVTGGGGKHVVFICPSAGLRNRIGLEPGIDIKADGGYFVAPPSRHASGRLYEWTGTTDAIAPMPPGLLARIEGRSSDGTTGGILNGNRNAALISLGGAARRAGLEESEILAALLVANAERCQEPLGEHEVETIARSAARYERGEFRPPPSWTGKTGARLLRERKAPPASLLGDGLLPVASLALLVGMPGLGKSWLTLQLAVALAAATPWLGVTTSSTPRRVGLVTLELDDSQLWRRLEAVIQAMDAQPSALERIATLSTDDIGGGIDLRDEGHLAALSSWCAELDLVVLDPLSRMHGAVENSAEEMGSVLRQLDRLRLEAKTAVLVVHHAKKPGERDSDLTAARGSSRLLSDPQLVMVLKEAAGRLQLVVPKANFAPAPEALWLVRSEEGPLATTSGPDTKGREDRTREALEILQAAGRPMAKAEVRERLEAEGHEAGEKTVLRYLNDLVGRRVVDRIGSGRNTRYVARDSGHDVSGHVPKDVSDQSDGGYDGSYPF